MESIFRKTLPELKRWQSGERIDHRKLNAPVDVLIANGLGVRGPRMVQAGGKGSPPVATGTVDSFEIAETDETGVEGTNAWDHAEYIVCVKLDDDGNKVQPLEFVKVAKPWELRRSSHDGMIRTDPTTGTELRYNYTENHERLALVVGVTKEIQTVIPMWIPGTKIEASAAPKKRTGNEDIKWVEAVSMRGWAARNDGEQ